MTLRSDSIRLAAALPQGDKTRRELLAALKTAGSPKILYPAVTDLLINYGILQPYTDIDQRLVAKATEKLLEALQKAALHSLWALDGPGYIDGFRSTGKRVEVYVYMKGSKQTAGGRHSPPAFDDQEDAEGEFDSEWKTLAEPLEIKYAVAAPEFLKGMSVLGHRVKSGKVKPFADTMLSHRRAINIVANSIAKFVAKQADVQAVVDGWEDDVLDTITLDYGKDFTGRVVVTNTQYKYGKPTVARDAITVPITTLVAVDIEDLEGEVDYAAIEVDMPIRSRYARVEAVRHNVLRRAARLPKGDETRRKILTNLKNLKR